MNKAFTVVLACWMCGVPVAPASASADDARRIVAESQRRTDAQSQRYDGLLQVFDAKGNLVYLGRIDNRVEGFGLARTQATQHELRDAIDQALAGKPVVKAFVQPVGCSIIRVK